MDFLNASDQNLTSEELLNRMPSKILVSLTLSGLALMTTTINSLVIDQGMDERESPNSISEILILSQTLFAISLFTTATTTCRYCQPKKQRSAPEQVRVYFGIESKCPWCSENTDLGYFKFSVPRFQKSFYCNSQKMSQNTLNICRSIREVSYNNVQENLSQRAQVLTK